MLCERPARGFGARALAAAVVAAGRSRRRGDGRGPASAAGARDRRSRVPRRVAAGAAARRPGAVEHQHVGDRALEEGAVVADDEEGAGPVVEEVLQGPQRVEVEVVGGLVEQQHVGLLGQREEELHPPSLTAREEADRRPLGVVLEPERLQQPSVGPVGLPVRARRPPRAPAGRVERRRPAGRTPRPAPWTRAPPCPRAARGGRR